MKPFFAWLNLFIIISTLGYGKLSYGASLSDKISSVPLVEYLQQKRIWNPEFDKEGSKEYIDLDYFVEHLNAVFNGDAKSIQIVVENIFNPRGETTSFDKFPMNYGVKFEMLRYYADSAGQSERVSKIFEEMYKKYVSMALTLISVSGVKEYEPIIKRVSQQIYAGQIRVVDLSPELRAKLAADEKSVSTHSHLTKEGGMDPTYRFNGLFSRSLGIIAVDLKRPVSECVVTLAHEIVHSSDPYLISKKEYVQYYTEQVKNKIATKLEVDPTAADLLAQALIKDVFHETGREDLFSLVQKLLETPETKKSRQQEEAAKAALAEAKQKLNLKELLEDPMIASWMANIIRSTIENEYRAYVLSLAVYYRLRTQFNILPFSENQNEFIYDITNHNIKFLRALELSMNPFMSGTELSKVYKTLFMEKRQKETDLSRRISFVKDVLIQHYTIQTEKLFSEIPTIYKDVLDIITGGKRETGVVLSNLPTYVQPGKFNSPDNPYTPYTVLTARVTTSLLMQFKGQLKVTLEALRKSRESLQLMQAHILPLHDLNFGELKLLGLQGARATLANVPEEVHESVRSTFVPNKDAVSQLFATFAWDPESLQDFKAINQDQVMKSIYLYNISRGLFWLREQFPIMKQNLVTLKVFGHKLSDDLLRDDLEISPARAAELRNEIQTILDNSFLSAGDIATSRNLVEELSTYYQVSKDNQWHELQSEFYAYLDTAVKALKVFGIGRESELAEIVQKNILAIGNLKKQIVEKVSAERRSCLDSPNLDVATTASKVRLGEGSRFPLTILCYNRKIYVLRQPGDHLGHIRALVDGNRLSFNFFDNSKPIYLEPIN